MTNKELANGYTYCPEYGAALRFEHFSASAAEQLVAVKEGVWIVETINHTKAGEGLVHRNEYMVYGFADALALATRIELSSAEVAEEVISILPATERQLSALRALDKRFELDMPAFTEAEIQKAATAEQQARSPRKRKGKS
jgi:hypothetical protein